MRYLLRRAMPDELWTSMLVRSIRRAGVGVGAATWALTSTRWTPSFFSLCQVGSVAELIRMDTVKALGEHTVLPYALAFVDEHRRQGALNAVHASGREVAGIAAVVQSVTDYVPFRRLCPACARTEHSMFGESSWHVSHNLPGVVVCLTHLRPLHVTALPTAGKHPWSAALPHEIGSSQRLCKRVTHFDIELAKSSVALLGVESLTCSARFPPRHREALIAKGLLSADRFASPPKVVAWLKDAIGESRRDLGLPVRDAGLAWAPYMLRSATAMSFPTFKHLCLQTAIAISAEASTPYLNHGFPRFGGDTSVARSRRISA